MRVGLSPQYLSVYYLNCFSLTTIHFSRAAWAYGKSYLKALDEENFSLTFFSLCDCCFLILMTLMIQANTKIPFMRASLRPIILIGLSANFLCFLGLPFLSIYSVGNTGLYLGIIAVMGLFQAVIVPSGILILNGMKTERTTDYTWMFIFQSIGHIIGFSFCLIVIEISGGSLAIVSFIGSGFFFLNSCYAFYALFRVKYNHEPCYEDCISEEAKKIIRGMNTINLPKKKPSTQKNHSSSYDSIMENVSDKSQRMAAVEISLLNQGLRRQNSAPFCNKTNRHSSNEETSHNYSFLNINPIIQIMTHALCLGMIQVIFLQNTLWTPLYLKEAGSSGYSTYYLIIYEASCLLPAIFQGSLLVGCVNKKLAYFPICFLLAGLFSGILYWLIPYKMFEINIVLFFFIGFFLGGPNNVAGILISDEHSRRNAFHFKEHQQKQIVIVDVISGLFSSSVQLFVGWAISYIYLINACFCLFLSFILIPVAYGDHHGRKHNQTFSDLNLREALINGELVIEDRD